MEELVRRYCQLASKPYLTEDEEQEFECLLKLAESEAELDFWFNEADHFLAHELGLTSSTTTCDEEQKDVNLQRSLKIALASSTNPYYWEEATNGSQNDEELESFEIHDTAAESINTFLAHSRVVYRQLQSRLKSYGYDPGPEDGFLREKTQLALKEFQADKCLIPNGEIDALTWEALGIRR